MTSIRALARQVNALLPPLPSRATDGSEADRDSSTPDDELTCLRHSAPTAFEASLYQPLVCLILQGEKETTAGDLTVRIGAGQCVVVSHDLPIVARITQATRRSPYLALVVPLDLVILRSLYAEVGTVAAAGSEANALTVADVDEQLVSIIGRRLDLLHEPIDARVLRPLVNKELHYRLLRSSAGGMLRALLHQDSHASRISTAIHTLREDISASLEVAALARSVGMSTSSFHKHFKQVTRTTPLQFQKDLRLTEARRLLRAGGATVSTTAFEVGYESPSQFSREYARKFGAPPQTDLARA